MDTYNKVNEILTDHNLKFSDCYQNPDILNFALKQLFNDAYMIVVEKIRNEFASLDDNRLSMFIEKLSE